MEEKQLRQLLKGDERELVDFKRDFYDSEGKDGKVSFVKDILAMANSCRNIDAYILCGIEQDKLSRETKVVGVPDRLFIDDAIWHQVVSKYASHPVGFQITKFRSSAHNVHLVAVRVYKDQNRPVICTKDEGGKLTAGAVYFRNGSMNDVATDLVTIEKMIAETANRTTRDPVESDPTYNRYAKFPPAPYYTFFGRKQEISDIYSKLINHHKNYLLSLFGDGGIGKTSVAHSLALDVLQKRDREEITIDDVIWISAKDQRIYEDQRLEINQEFKSLDDLFNKILLVFHSPSDIRSLTLEQKRDRVEQALVGTRFLFVLDNLEVFTSVELGQIIDFISNTPQGHKFLITSRHDIRVHDFIELIGMDDDTFKEYCEDVMAHFQIEEITAEQVRQEVHKLFSMTNGNPLYLKFFLAQIKKGRRVADIISRKNTEGERGLKQYCFDTTLGQLSDKELLTMYAIATADSELVSLNELVFMTRLERAELTHIADELIAVSLINSTYANDEKSYLMNQFLKSHLKEERRIPAAEVAKLVGRSRSYYSALGKVDAPTRLNFFLGDDLPKNKTASFNSTFDVLKDGHRMDPGVIKEKLRDAARLYPGNYLVPFIKYFGKVVNTRRSGYMIYADMNAEFNALVPDIADAPDLVGMYVWKSLLNTSLGRLDDILLDLSSEAVTTNELYDVGESLIACLRGVAYHLKAIDAYRTQHPHDHDTFREIADELFGEHIDSFMSQPFFYFIKKDIFYNYSAHVWHMRKERVPYRSLEPVQEDYKMLRGVAFTALRPISGV